MNDIYNLHNTECEREVIGACVSEENIFVALGEQLREELFSDPIARKAYGVMRQMIKEGKQPDLAEVGMRLAVVGISIADILPQHTVSYEMTRQRIELLQELSLKRKLYVLCSQGIKISTDPTATSDDFQKLLAEMQSTTTDDGSGVVTLGETMRRLRGDIIERREGKGEQGMMTGLHIFDSRFGWHGGDLVIMAGRTSQGKTTLAMTIASNMAHIGIPSVFYSLEMGAKQLTARIIARDTMVVSSRMLYDKLNDGELAKYDESAQRMSDLPIFFDDKAKTSFSRICTSIRSMVRNNGVKVAYIDYLQILANGKGEDNREQLIGDMARDLKRLAVELNICVVAISQLARSKDNPEPKLSELRGSGQIEEACDMAVLVYRPYVYGKERYRDGRSTYGTAQITIAKGRNIGLAQEVVSFNGELTYFYDIPAGNTGQPSGEKMPWDGDDNEMPF